MIGKYLNKINKNVGIILFKCPNTLYYYIFNKAHQALISNKKTNDVDVDKYIKDGFFKTNVESSQFCKLISSKINMQKINNSKTNHVFSIDQEMRHLIKEHILSNFSETIMKLENFYKSKISIADIRISRNFYLDNPTMKAYSNDYHSDYYTYNHFKLFINLMDIELKNGPLHYYSKTDTKEFIKINNYKNRSNYIDNELYEKLKTNTGKIGESLVVSTTECIHKAGKVEKGVFRDMMFVTFITIPEKLNKSENYLFYYEKVFPDIIWGKNDEENKILKITKPQSLIKTIKLFFKYLKNKLN